jgi:hypothetical protein
MNKILAIIAGVLAFLAGLAGLYKAGKEKGKNEVKQAQTEENLKVVDEIKKQNDNIDSMSVDDAREQLRECTRN